LKAKGLAKFYELAGFATLSVAKTLSIILHIEYDKIDEFYKLVGVTPAKIIPILISIDKKLAENKPLTKEEEKD
jgi:hypothetical protein